MGIREQKIRLEVSKGDWNPEVEELMSTIRAKRASITLDVQQSGATPSASTSAGGGNPFMDLQKFSDQVNEAATLLTRLGDEVTAFNQRARLTIEVDTSQIKAAETQLRNIQEMITSISNQRITLNVQGGGAAAGGAGSGAAPPGGGGGGAASPGGSGGTGDPFSNIRRQAREASKAATQVNVESGNLLFNTAKSIARNFAKRGVTQIPAGSSFTSIEAGIDQFRDNALALAQIMLDTGQVAPPQRKKAASTKASVQKPAKAPTISSILAGIRSQTGIDFEKAAETLAKESLKTGVPLFSPLTPPKDQQELMERSLINRAAEKQIELQQQRAAKIKAPKASVQKPPKTPTLSSIVSEIISDSGIGFEEQSLRLAQRSVKTGIPLFSSLTPPADQADLMKQSLINRAGEHIANGTVKAPGSKVRAPKQSKATTVSANRALREIEKDQGIDVDKAASKLAKAVVEGRASIPSLIANPQDLLEQKKNEVAILANQLITSGQIQKGVAGKAKTQTALQADAGAILAASGIDPEFNTLAQRLATQAIQSGQGLASPINATPRQQALINRAQEIVQSRSSGQLRLKRAVEEFRETATVKEVLAGFFQGSDARLKARRQSALEFQTKKGIPGLATAIEADIAARGLSSLVDIRNLGKGQVIQQLGFAGIFGGLPGILSAAAGAITPLGVEGALIGSTIQQAVGGLLEPILIAFRDKRHEFEEAGLTFQRSILGISAVLQSTSQVIGVGGGPIANVRTALSFQEQRATDIQLAARGRLARIGIGGATEATFVQGIASALSARGITFTPDQLATIAGRLGSAIITQRPQILENPSLLLRDISDLFSGGPAARRVLISQIGGVRQALPSLQRARTAEDFVEALTQAGQFESALRASTNISAVRQRIEGTQDLLTTAAGTEFLNRVRRPTLEFGKTLGIEGVEGSDTEKTFKVLGRLIGDITSIGIDWTTSLLRVANIMTPLVQNTLNFADALGKLLPLIVASIGVSATTRGFLRGGAVGQSVGALFLGGGTRLGGATQGILGGLGALFGSQALTQAGQAAGQGITSRAAGLASFLGSKAGGFLRVAGPLAVLSGAFGLLQSANEATGTGLLESEDATQAALLQSLIAGAQGRPTQLISGAFQRLGLDEKVLDIEKEVELSPGFRLANIDAIQREFGGSREFRRFALPTALLRQGFIGQELSERAGVFGASLGQQLSAARFERDIASPERFAASVEANEAALSKYNDSIEEAQKFQKTEADQTKERIKIEGDLLRARTGGRIAQREIDKLRRVPTTEAELNQVATASLVQGAAGIGNAITQGLTFAGGLLTGGVQALIGDPTAFISEALGDRKTAKSIRDELSKQTQGLFEIAAGETKLFPDQPEDFSDLRRREKDLEDLAKRRAKFQQDEAKASEDLFRLDSSKTVGDIKDILAAAENVVKTERDLLKTREASVKALEREADLSDKRFQTIAGNFFTGSPTDLFNRGLIETFSATDQLRRNQSIITSRQVNIEGLTAQFQENQDRIEAARSQGNIEVVRTFEKVGQDIQLQIESNQFDVEQARFQRVGLLNRQFQSQDLALRAIDAEERQQFSAFDPESLFGRRERLRVQAESIARRSEVLKEQRRSLQFPVQETSPGFIGPVRPGLPIGEALRSERESRFGEPGGLIGPIRPEFLAESVKRQDRERQITVSQNLEAQAALRVSREGFRNDAAIAITQIDRTLLRRQRDRNDIENEEIEKRRVLTRELEAASEALRNFSDTAREARIDRTSGIAQAAARVQALGGSIPSFLQFDSAQLRGLELAQATGSLNRLLRETGLPQIAQQGADPLLGLGGQFESGLEAQRLSLRETIRSRTRQLEDLGDITRKRQRELGLKIFNANVALSPADIPEQTIAGTTIPAGSIAALTQGTQTAFFESQLARLGPLAELTKNITESSTQADDIKVIGETVGTMQTLLTATNAVLQDIVGKVNKLDKEEYKVTGTVQVSV